MYVQCTHLALVLNWTVRTGRMTTKVSWKQLHLGEAVARTRDLNHELSFSRHPMQDICHFRLGIPLKLTKTSRSSEPSTSQLRFQRNTNTLWYSRQHWGTKVFQWDVGEAHACVFLAPIKLLQTSSVLAMILTVCHVLYNVQKEAFIYTGTPMPTCVIRPWKPVVVAYRLFEENNPYNRYPHVHVGAPLYPKQTSTSHPSFDTNHSKRNKFDQTNKFKQMNLNQ